MKFSEFVKYNKLIFKNDSLVKVTSVKLLSDEYYCINNSVPIKIDAIGTLYEKGKEIDIINENGDTLGTLCLTTEDEIVPLHMFSENRYIAYLADVSYADYISFNYIIKSCYAIINKDKLNEYLGLIETSPIWGNYFHNGTVHKKLMGLQKNIPFIKAVDKLSFPTDIHKNNSINTILEPFTFERFLKKYHQIELLSDLDVVNRIKALNDDLYGIGELISEINSNDLHRLRLIMKNRIKSIDTIIDAMGLVSNFQHEAESIFQKYSKNGNPLPELSDFIKILGLPDFKETSLKTFRSTLKGDKYINFIIELSSYWIYRIRCSIAHKRIGEYVITPKDEKFILEFGEPLIESIVIEMLKKP